MDAGAVP
jgi:hypothetical protein